MATILDLDLADCALAGPWRRVPVHSKTPIQRPRKSASGLLYMVK
jgi:hypothetical protein